MTLEMQNEQCIREEIGDIIKTNTPEDAEAILFGERGLITKLKNTEMPRDHRITLGIEAIRKIHRARKREQLGM